MSALNTAATGMLAQQRNVEVISNNIANLNTVGYKRQRGGVSGFVVSDSGTSRRYFIGHRNGDAEWRSDWRGRQDRFCLSDY